MDLRGQIQQTGRGRTVHGGARPLGWVVAGIALLVVAGCLHLLLAVTADQQDLARHGRWLLEAGSLRAALEDVAYEAEAHAAADPVWFSEQIPAIVRREVESQQVLGSLPLEDGRAVRTAWRNALLPLETAVGWLTISDGVRPEVVAEPARELARAITGSLPHAAVELTRRSEQLDADRAWLLGVGLLIALGAVVLTVLYTRLRRHRDALVAFSAALHENEERYRQMFEQNNGIKLLIAPGDGHIVEANEAACTFYGGSIDALRAMRMTDLVAGPENAGRELLVVRTHAEQSTLCMQHRLLDGNVRDVEMHVSPITVRGNRLLYAIVHDVTEKLALEKEIRRADQLESLGVLAGGIAHDFNNFLAGMIGNLQLAQLDVEPDSSVAQALDAADGACRRAQELARQLLTFTKRGAPVRQATDLAELLRQTVTFALRGTAATWELDIDPALSAANLDETQIGQVLHNLVINAHQAMPDGGTVRVKATNRAIAKGDGLALQPGPYVHIRVTDEGIGIPAADLDRIFQPYFTTKESGTGLGLATSYSIVRKHEGALTVESTVGSGTIFHLLLPAAAKRPVAARPRRPTSATLGGEHILWLEDEPTIGNVIERMLERYGYRIEVFADGADLLKRFEEARASGADIDLIVLDLLVPEGLGGKETLECLRAIDPEVRALACSGNLGDEAMQDPTANGFVAALRKPFSRETLAAALIDALPPRRASHAA